MDSVQYWIYLEPFVYVSFKQEGTMLYNTLNASCLIITDNDTKDIVSGLYDPNNCGVVGISELQSQKNNILEFIKKIRDNFMGDIITVSVSSKKPIQFVPTLNFQHDVDRIINSKVISIDEVISDCLQSITVYVNSSKNRIGSYFKQIVCPCVGYDDEIPIDKLLLFLSRAMQSGARSFDILGGKIFEYEWIDKLMSFICATNVSFTLGGFYEDIPANRFSSIKASNIALKIFVEPQENMVQLRQFFKYFIDHELRHTVVFMVDGERSFEEVGMLIEEFVISDYEILPIYTGDNEGFYKEYVFMNKEDILSNPISIKEIFARQVLNSNFFGKLTVMPDGRVYSNINCDPLGTIDNQISMLLCEEIVSRRAWRRIRDKSPCSECVFQFLCPPSSNYEFIMGHPNLCNVKSLFRER